MDENPTGCRRAKITSEHLPNWTVSGGSSESNKDWRPRAVEGVPEALSPSNQVDMTLKLAEPQEAKRLNQGSDAAHKQYRDCLKLFTAWFELLAVDGGTCMTLDFPILHRYLRSRLLQ